MTNETQAKTNNFQFESLFHSLKEKSDPIKNSELNLLFEELKSSDLPTKKLEGWKNTSLKKLLPENCYKLPSKKDSALWSQIGIDFNQLSITLELFYQ